MSKLSDVEYIQKFYKLVKHIAKAFPHLDQDDAFQEGCITLLEMKSKYNDKLKSSYLCQALKWRFHAMTTRMNNRSRREEPYDPTEFAYERVGTTQDTFTDIDAEISLIDSFDYLTEEQKKIILLSSHGFNISEIGRMCNKSKQWIWYQYKRSLDLLQNTEKRKVKRSLKRA